MCHVPNKKDEKGSRSNIIEAYFRKTVLNLSIYAYAGGKAKSLKDSDCSAKLKEITNGTFDGGVVVMNMEDGGCSQAEFAVRIAALP